jgi:uncharacterized phage protein (TIGR02218 family)
MRNIDLSKLTDNASELQNICYCFEITPAKSTTLFLTSGQEEIKSHDITYLPFSGVCMREAVFNDSAQNHVYLHGIFEEKGINSKLDITYAAVKILIYTSGRLQELVTMYCTEFIKNDLEFSIKLEPEVIKYNQSLLLTFSNSCRANFGDKKCKIDKQLVSYKSQITLISGSIIKCNEITHESGYFKGGQVIACSEEGRAYSCRILSHFLTQIEVEEWFAGKVKILQEITLIPGCDKKFRTCCNKFDNALNFRGEPFVPEYKYLKN